MLSLDFLAAANGVALTKTFTRDDEGKLEKHPYPLVKNLTSHREAVDTIDEFYDAIVRHAAQGHCLLKGQLDRPLVNESRAGHTQADQPTGWLMLDSDHLPDVPPEELLSLLGLDDVDHVLQYSASTGIVEGKRNYHIFLFLDKEYSPSELKPLSRHWNLTIPRLSRNLCLANSKIALLWPLDVTVVQNDKLLYIASPECGPGVEDTLGEDRIQLKRGAKPFATLDLTAVTEAGVAEMEKAAINRLRQAEGLPPKKLGSKKHCKLDVAKNPDQAVVTSIKEERGFVYLNLNGGDSEAYYHATGNPEILHNFKGEPDYATKEIAPEYYPQAVKRAEEVKAEQRRALKVAKRQAYMQVQQAGLEQARDTAGRVYLAFRDRASDQYYAGFHDFAKMHSEFDAVSSKDKAADYLAQHGQPAPEMIETWDYTFHPETLTVFDAENRFINRFEPSEYLKRAQAGHSEEVPPTIRRVIGHALGDDPKLVEHFLNWLSVIFQCRRPTQTAWILQGTTGTGKGLLFNGIIRPLLGARYCRSLTLPQFEDQFNAYMEETLVLLVDEVDTDQVRHMPKLIGRLKSQITEPMIGVRAMRENLREVPNRLNVMMASNQPNSMRIETNDRRFTVCPRQEEKLFLPNEDKAALVAKIEAELQGFAHYLMSRTADVQKAQQPVENEAKRQLQSVTQSALEEVVAALKDGNLRYFVEHLPEQNPANIDLPRQRFEEKSLDVPEEYCRVIENALEWCESTCKQGHLLRHKDLFVLCEQLAGSMPSRKVKLTKRLAHVNLEIKPHTRDNTSNRGFIVKWRASPKEITSWKAQLKRTKRPQFSNPKMVQWRNQPEAFAQLKAKIEAQAS